VSWKTGNKLIQSASNERTDGFSPCLLDAATHMQLLLPLKLSLSSPHMCLGILHFCCCCCISCKRCWQYGAAACCLALSSLHTASRGTFYARDRASAVPARAEQSMRLDRASAVPKCGARSHHRVPHCTPPLPHCTPHPVLRGRAADLLMHAAVIHAMHERQSCKHGCCSHVPTPCA
jgi:hypothetical protein